MGLTRWTWTFGGTGIYTMNLRWNNPVKSDLDLYVHKVNCSRSRPSCVLGKSISGEDFETVSWPVQKGDRFWVTIDKYSGRSTSYTLSGFYAE